MPVEEKLVVHITCDNPNCPGTDKSATDRAGWLFVTSEIYGDPPAQHVFCSPECSTALSLAVQPAA
jgi:hypothetical protein